MVAVALVGGALASVAQLVMATTRATLSARGSTLSATLASRKLEELRSEATGASTGGGLAAAVSGFSDVFDAHGRPTTDPFAVFERRWLVQPLAADPGHATVMQVRAFRRTSAGSSQPWPALAECETRLATVVGDWER